jgi:hypothetical protein
MTPDARADPRLEERVHTTYRYLRLITVMPAIWLILAIVVVALVRSTVYDSISDYYGGPLRDVFVGVLMASGICLIAYKGESRLEDYALNFAGINMVVVALVPNSFPAVLEQARAAENTSSPPPVSSADLAENLGIAVTTFLVIVVGFALLDRRLLGWMRPRWSRISPFARILIGTAWVLELAVVVLVLIVVATSFSDSTRTWPFSWTHFGAATCMILNLTFAAASHAFPTRLRTVDDCPGDTAKVRTAFMAISGGMALGLVVGLPAIAAGVDYATITVEIYEIVLFIAFWLVATREEWFSVGRRSRRT